MQVGLEERGCQVTRLNTYDTVPVESLDEEQLKAARAVDVVAIASPSAVEALVHHVDRRHVDDLAIACIGKGLETEKSSACSGKVFRSGP